MYKEVKEILYFFPDRVVALICHLLAGEKTYVMILVSPCDKWENSLNYKSQNRRRENCVVKQKQIKKLFK